MSVKDMLFNKFVQFVQDLNEVFGEKNKSIRMYNIVLQKMVELRNEGKQDVQQRITQHVSILEKFMRDNNQAVMKQDVSLLVSKQIRYSESIYIDIEMVLRHSEENSAIWKHLLLFESLISPESNAHEVLNKLIEDDSDEAKLIKNIASKLESEDVMSKLGNINPANPFGMIQSLTSSGLMDSIMGGMQGDMSKVNPKKLIGTMRNMLDMISSQIEQDPSVQDTD